MENLDPSPVLHHKSSNAFEVERCFDVAFIDHVFTTLKPLLDSEYLSEIPPAEKLLAAPGFVFISVAQDGNKEGLVMLVDNEIHTLFLPSLRGGRAVRAGREILRWIWANTTFPAVRSFVAPNRPEVAYFARILGFDFVGEANGFTTLALMRPQDKGI